MDDINTSVENSLHFSSQSTTEIFNKLLDIRPDNHFLNEVNSEFLRANDLDESVFDPCRLENSTMCDEIKNFTEEVRNKCHIYLQLLFLFPLTIKGSRKGGV